MIENIFFQLSVDDIITNGDNSTRIAQLKDYLNQHFQIKDLGNRKDFLGIDVARLEDKASI